MTTQPKSNGYIGDTASILLVMFGPKQQDSHVTKYRWHLRLQDADRSSAAVVEYAQEMNAKMEIVS